MLQHVGDCFLNAVEEGVLVEHAVRAALGAGSVVAEDVEDERVVELAHLFERLKEAADFVVAVFAEGGVDLHLMGEEFFLVRVEGVPILDGLGLGCEFGAGGNDAELDLASERLFAEFVPALIELAFVFGDPLFGHVVRSMRCSRSEVDEEGFVRREGLLEFHPVDGMIGHVGHEVVAGIVRRGDHVEAVIEGGRPLVGLAADEAVELVEAGA